MPVRYGTAIILPDICDRVSAGHDGSSRTPTNTRVACFRTISTTPSAPPRREETGKNPYGLERRLGRRSQRYIARYTNRPEHVAAGYAEDL